MLLVWIQLLSLPSFLLSVEHPACCISHGLHAPSGSGPLVFLFIFLLVMLFSSCSLPLHWLQVLTLCLHDHLYLGDFWFVLFWQICAKILPWYWAVLIVSLRKKASGKYSVKDLMWDTSLSISCYLCCLYNCLGLPHCCPSHPHCFLILALNL